MHHLDSTNAMRLIVAKNPLVQAGARITWYEDQRRESFHIPIRNAVSVLNRQFTTFSVPPVRIDINRYCIVRVHGLQPRNWLAATNTINRAMIKFMVDDKNRRVLGMNRWGFNSMAGLFANIKPESSILCNRQVLDVLKLFCPKKVRQVGDRTFVYFRHIYGEVELIVSKFIPLGVILNGNFSKLHIACNIPFYQEVPAKPSRSQPTDLAMVLRFGMVLEQAAVSIFLTPEWAKHNGYSE